MEQKQRFVTGRKDRITKRFFWIKRGNQESQWKGREPRNGQGAACNTEKKLKCHQPSSGRKERCWRHRSVGKKSDDTRVIVTWCRAPGQNGPGVPTQGDVAVPERVVGTWLQVGKRASWPCFCWYYYLWQVTCQLGPKVLERCSGEPQT